MTKKLEKTSTGLQPNLAAVFCYLGGFVTGIIFLILEKDSKFVRFHAMQSIITFGAMFVLQVVCMALFFFVFLIPIINIIWVILWIILMLKAYKGEKFKLPMVGDIAEKQI